MSAALRTAARLAPRKKATNPSLGRSPLGPNRDRHRDGARPGREWQRQREERELHRIAVAARRFRALVPFVVGMGFRRSQEAPAAERHHGPPGDAQSVDRNAEKAQNIGAGPQSAEHDRERVEANEGRGLLLVGLREVPGHPIEDERPADRVDDREQRGKGEQESGICRGGEVAPIRTEKLFHAAPDPMSETSHIIPNLLGSVAR